MPDLSTDRLQPTARVPRVPQPQVQAPRQETNRNPRRRAATPPPPGENESEEGDTPAHQIDDLA